MQAIGTLVSSSANVAYGTLGAGTTSAEPQWVKSDAPIKVQRDLFVLIRKVTDCISILVITRYLGWWLEQGEYRRSYRLLDGSNSGIRLLCSWYEERLS